MDVLMTYYLLKVFPQQFIELNPVTNFLIKKLGLDLALAFFLPAIYLALLFFLYYIWGLCLKKNYRVVLGMITIGYFIALVVRFGAVLWNLREICRTFC